MVNNESQGLWSGGGHHGKGKKEKQASIGRKRTVGLRRELRFRNRRALRSQ